jgi:hypothetical protein
MLLFKDNTNFFQQMTAKIIMERVIGCTLEDDIAGQMLQPDQSGKPEGWRRQAGRGLHPLKNRLNFRDAQKI